MEKLIEAHKTVLNVLGKAKVSDSKYRLTNYCVTKETDDGVLLFHTLTRELLLLTAGEYEKILESEYLKERWFAVPEEINEKEYADLVRWVCKSRKKTAESVTKYTILTTTECNARCFYCYEKGYQKYPMSAETAYKTADFIEKNCNGNKVHIGWFGGEPLYNADAIDIICRRLQEKKISWQCSMTSNGYLFNDDMVQKAVNDWKLKTVQITLDGTEKVYNRSKAYIYREGSAYQIVIKNIQRLLDAGIIVNIRLNMNLGNADDLCILAEELAERFKGQTKLNVYAHLIFEGERSWEEVYSREELIRLYGALYRLEEKLNREGLLSQGKKGLFNKTKLSYCMADSGNAVVITPDGHLGLCEHCIQNDFIGHMDSEIRDTEMIESWREIREEIPECKTCFYYPECIRPKKCISYGGCFDLQREYIRYGIKRAMDNELLAWKTKQE